MMTLDDFIEAQKDRIYNEVKGVRSVELINNLNPYIIGAFEAVFSMIKVGASIDEAETAIKTVIERRVNEILDEEERRAK